MTQILGGGLVGVLVVALLTREAIAIGLLRTTDSVRHGLTVVTAALAVAFLVVVSVHLATL